ncbi:hypothetical protein FG386_001078 [Cryptosporidium ryanae]|uniref:uncharacterized protein n=1 Tax=Cryptosporidium ryanae TaxID=515981 RepID=UPI00351A7B1A|nr:hypothetical protein FG386_001078 [Cryptosporidium ryanae]
MVRKPTLCIGVLGSNYDETITKYDTFVSVILQSCKNYYKNKPKGSDMVEIEKEVERIQMNHVSDRIAWCNEWLPVSPTEKFESNSIGKLFLAISEFEYIYNFKIEKEMSLLNILNKHIVDNSSIMCKDGWEFREGAFETLDMLTNYANKFIIISVSKGSKRISDTIEDLMNSKKCQFELVANEFEYNNKNEKYESSENSLFGPSCKYRAFKHSVKEYKRNKNRKIKEKFYYFISKLCFYSSYSRDIYIKSIYFGNRANDLECILYAEVGVFILDQVDSESLCDVPTADYTLSSDQTYYYINSNSDNSINMDTFAFKICELFSIQIVPILDIYSDNIKNSGLKLYENVKRNSVGVVDIKDYIRISRRLRYTNSKFSQFRFTGILLLAFSWGDISKLFSTDNNLKKK